jgi:hypothetical protein
MNEEFARSWGLIQPHERLHPNVHGLAILPDDDLSRFPIVSAEATARADPAQFEGALTELAAGQRVRLSAAGVGVRLLFPERVQGGLTFCPSARKGLVVCLPLRCGCAMRS